MKTQTIPTLEQAFSGTLFGSAAMPQNGKTIVEISPSELEEIKNQPFRAYNSDKLSELADSILKNGQMQPCIVRKKDGKYIILAGRNRKRACQRLGIKVKCIVLECSDAEADLILTDTNLYQRHELLPSELAAAYAMQKAAYEAKGERKSTAAIADAYGETVKTVYRYIKLNDLDKKLLSYVDEGRIPVMAGVALTNTEDPEDQRRLAEYMIRHPKLKISVKQAEGLIHLEKEHGWYTNVLDEFFKKKAHEKNSETLTTLTQKTSDEEVKKSTDTYHRMTLVKSDGSYWSPNTREELIQRLAEYEDMFPDGPDPTKCH
ncbi:ParB/RepB/Spo0J family partition protein [Thermocaproicibacter melissae]|jgi:ParB family chromosome partitioning protein|uniref:ParB/RepB/Spo0J family partition protein n=1 Tax=Thermocaproicibacter melissae TaxID=2966552 RepID=UPI0024B078EB|nr:ParB/RepB/Spo0J family partition protein [Thermocaproicibacter melissae]WBY64719.1 ParB/RepB/Spo0J family partition protein [Thermocaproicibacter melissae]